MYSIRATAVGVSSTSLDRRRARSDSAPDAGTTIMNGTATTTMRKVGGAAGGATAFPSASASASASAAAQSELPLQSARSSHEDDDGPVAGEHRSYSSSGGDTSLSGGASAGRYNRPLHVTDGSGLEGPAVEGEGSVDRQHRIAMMNGRAATDGHHHRPVAKRDGGAVYPQQQAKQRRAVVAPLDHHRERNASTAATNHTGVGGRASGPGSGVPAAPLTPTRGSGGGGDGGAAAAAANATAATATPSYFAATTPKRRPRPSQQQQHTPANTPQRVVDSPLIDASQTSTPLSAPEANLVKHEDRWRAMSALAGPHMQDPTVLDLSHRSHLPFETLKFGVPPKVAANVTHLKYDGAALLGGGGGGGGRRRHDLPAFLDLVCQLFPRLEHISLDGGGGGNEEEEEENGDGPEGRCGPTAASLSRTAGPRNGDSGSSGGGSGSGGSSGNDPKKSKLDAAIEAANRETVRMRRLYLLYRLPDLRSIDGVPVSSTERNLARPSSPAGYRVRKEDWLTGAMAAVNNKVGGAAAVRGGAGTDKNADHDKDGDDGASDDDDHGGYYGGGRDSVIDSEDGVGGTCSGSAVEVSICGLVNYVRTPDEGGGGEGDGADTDRSSTLGGRADGQPSEPDVVQLRIDVSDSINKGNAVTTPGRSGSLKNGRAASGGAPRGSRPPPSPASKLRTFPAPRQKRRGGGGGKRLSSRRLWRQRKNNVVSMVDAEEEEEEDEECAATDDNAHGGEDYEEEVGGEKENGVHWAGTLETISYMEGTTDQNKQP